MFESHTNSDIIGLLFPSYITDEGRRLNLVLEDLYPELCRQGIDILMLAGNPYYDYNSDDSIDSCQSYDSYGSYQWKYIYSNDELFNTIRMHYDIYNAPALLWVNSDGEILEENGKNMILCMSNMNDSKSVARSIASQFRDYEYDSDW